MFLHHRAKSSNKIITEITRLQIIDAYKKIKNQILSMIIISITHVAPQMLIVLFLIYLFDNIIQLISLRSLWYYGGW
jgi:hypothetical protein